VLAPTFFASSMDGELAYCDFVKPPDVEHPDYVKSISNYHYGPVVGLHRSPFFEDVVLSVGDWAFKVRAVTILRRCGKEEKRDELTPALRHAGQLCCNNSCTPYREG
jgi:hypothetical protein